MIQAGDVIENPVTGERLVFRKTSRETNGEAVVLETFVKPNGFGKEPRSAEAKILSSDMS